MKFLLGTFLIALGLGSLATTAHAQAVLTLGRVMESAARAHPLVLEAAAQLEAARAKQTEAAGNFDFVLKAELQYAPAGKYDEALAFVGFEQPTPFRGLRFHGGYRNGASFPVYYGGDVTSQFGEASLGIVLPLLRGAAIDGPRFERIKARLATRQSEMSARMRRIDVLANAATGWYRWVAQGKRMKIAETLAELADSRTEFMREQVARGATPSIELVDNDRLVAGRHAQVIAEQQKLLERALALSLYLRDRRGDPLLPDQAHLPPDLPHPEELPAHELSEGIERARSRPDVVALETAVELLTGEARLADNQRLPDLDLSLQGSQDFGETRSYSPYATSVNETTVVAGLTFKLPVQRRAARGKSENLKRTIDAVRERLRLAQDSAVLETRAAWTALVAAREQASLATRAREAAERLAEAERERLVAGQSSILTVNLREQATAAAALAELEAILAHHEARVRFQASSASPRLLSAGAPLAR